MKKHAILFVIVTVLIFGGCKTKTISTAPPKQEGKEIEVEVPCKKEATEAGKSVYRAYGIGQSVNEQEAIRAAVDNAHDALAQKIIELAERTRKLYAQNTNIQEAMKFEEITEREAKLTSRTFIADSRTICDKTFITHEKVYKSYVCIETDIDAEKRYFENLIKKSLDQLKLKYDAAAYEKSHKEAIDEFNKEYEKRIGN